MPPRVSGMSPAFAAAFGIFWFLFMGGIVVVQIIMIIALWRLMKAHEKIANKLSEIAERLQLK